MRAPPGCSRRGPVFFGYFTFAPKEIGSRSTAKQPLKLREPMVPTRDANRRFNSAGAKPVRMRDEAAFPTYAGLSVQPQGDSMLQSQGMRSELSNLHHHCFAMIVMRSLILSFIGLLGACNTSRDDNIGVGITGIDHLADHVSIQDFWVDGYNAFQAGKGGRLACCATIPRVWRPGIMIKVRWAILVWPISRGVFNETVVPLEQYDEPGTLWIHFLADGSVRAVSSIDGPRSPQYPGPRDPIPQKFPWDVYPLKQQK